MKKLTGDEKDALAEIMVLEGWSVVKALLASSAKEHRDLVAGSNVDTGSRTIVLRKARLEGVMAVERMMMEAEMLVMKGQG